MLNLILLVTMILAAIWSVMARSLLKSAIGLAVISLVITIFMFRFNAPLAGVFELSVCTGLITVIFLSTIGLTKPMTHKEILEQSKDRARRYWPLPVLVILSGLLAGEFLRPPLNLSATAEAMLVQDVRIILWNLRQLDLFGQIIVLLAGVFGAVILFKEINIDEW